MSRLRIVEAADDARRRIERDLHDGAQQQLVSLALDLRMLKARLGDSGLASTVDEIGEKLAVALAELREFARGIHPAFLSERGVGAAVEALVARAPLERRGDGRARRAPARAGRGRRLLRDRRGADQRRPLRRDAPTRRCSVSRDGGEVVVVVDRRRQGRRDDRGRDRPARADRPARGARRAAGGRQPARRRHALEAHIPIEPGSLVAEAARSMRRRASLLLVLVLVLAGCGEQTQRREPDLVVRGDDAVATREAPDRQTRGVRIATARIVFITHGQASDPFWNDRQARDHEARRQTGAAVSYRAPDRFSIERMRRFIDEAVADRPGRAGRLAARRDGARALDQGRGRGRHPVDHDQLRQRRVPALGVLAHVGQPEYEAGVESRRADGARGRAARAVRQPGDGNSGLDQRCRGLRDGLAQDRRDAAAAGRAAAEPGDRAAADGRGDRAAARSTASSRSARAAPRRRSKRSARAA